VNEKMQQEYIALLVFIGLSSFIAIMIVVLSLVIVARDGEVEKLTAYECGFQPFQDTRLKFDVRFYLVAILFIIFDLEITFVFPWVIYTGDFEFCAYIGVVVFLILLTIGFVYEWVKGALEW
jgi:NADH-quinone oxidoreductase subunit A